MPPLKHPKQEKFCLEYFALGNATDASIKAGYAVKSARSIASENLTKPNIIARIKALQAKAESDKIASVIERKQVLTEIIRGRINQYTSGNHINATAQNLNSAAVAEVVTSEIQVGKGDNAAIVEITKLKLRDPVAAIAELNKMEGEYAPEKHELTGKDGGPVQFASAVKIILQDTAEPAQIIEGEVRELPAPDSSQGV